MEQMSNLVSTTIVGLNLQVDFLEPQTRKFMCSQLAKIADYNLWESILESQIREFMCNNPE